jgi:hypothetical protein
MPASRISIALVVAIVIFTARPAPAAPVADEYIKGYAAAILAREFKTRAPSLRVSNGIVHVTESDLAGVDRSAVLAALSAIDGVTRVVVLGSQPRPVSVSNADVGPSALLETGRLPPGLLFQPLLADPRWPHFSLGYRQYFDEDGFDAIIAGTIGENLPFYRWTWRDDHQWEVGGLALVTPLFDRTNDDDLLTEDYLLGVFLGWRHGRLSGLFRAYHTSSHIGDELALRGTIQRVNLSYETLDARLSWDVAPELRVYGGAGYLVRRDPRSLDPWWLQLGLEYRSRWRAWNLLRPIAAVDLQSHEQNDWQPALSLRAGVQVDSLTVLGRTAQLLLEYYVGDSRDGQFYGRDVEYIGIGVHFNF